MQTKHRESVKCSQKFKPRYLHGTNEFQKNIYIVHWTGFLMIPLNDRPKLTEKNHLRI